MSVIIIINGYVVWLDIRGQHCKNKQKNLAVHVISTVCCQWSPAAAAHTCPRPGASVIRTIAARLRDSRAPLGLNGRDTCVDLETRRCARRDATTNQRWETACRHQQTEYRRLSGCKSLIYCPFSMITPAEALWPVNERRLASLSVRSSFTLLLHAFRF